MEGEVEAAGVDDKDEDNEGGAEFTEDGELDEEESIVIDGAVAAVGTAFDEGDFWRFFAKMRARLKCDWKVTRHLV